MARLDVAHQEPLALERAVQSLAHRPAHGAVAAVGPDQPVGAHRLLDAVGPLEVRPQPAGVLIEADEEGPALDGPTQGRQTGGQDPLGLGLGRGHAERKARADAVQRQARQLLLRLVVLLARIELLAHPRLVLSLCVQHRRFLLLDLHGRDKTAGGQRLDLRQHLPVAGHLLLLDRQLPGDLGELPLQQGHPRPQGLALLLTQLLGLPYADAAAVCGCPVGTIRSRVARARDALLTDAERDDLTG